MLSDKEQERLWELEEKAKDEFLLNTAWKTLKLKDGIIKSENGNRVWKINTWYHEDEIILCNKGFHASKLCIDAMHNVIPDVFALVEYKGKVLEENDKLVSQDMRIIKAYLWTKPDSLRFSIFCVKQSMKYFDRKEFPDVWKVCLNSIKVIDAVLLNDCEETRSAARSAMSAAESAAESVAESAAKSAVGSAAWSAAKSAVGSAARSAESAAESAAESVARSVAWSVARSAAWSVARSADWSAAKKLQHKWLVKYIQKNCKQVK
jgi:hypothetical protein